MATKAALLPNFSQAFVRKLSKVLLLTSVGTVLTASPGWAAVVAPTAVTVTVPSGSNNGTRNGSSATTAYIDDILLSSIDFSGTIFRSSSTSFSDVRQFRVTDQRTNINAEFGDADLPSNGSSDGNPNPFVSGGVATTQTDLSGTTNTIRESTDPNIQDRALQAAFNSLSISQGTDGEVAYTYRATFDQGIVDNDRRADNIPELIFFERGANSAFSVRAIIGGTFDAPTYAANTVSVTAAQLTPSGIFIDTSEIDTGQQLGVVGIDLNEFGIADVTTAIYGIELTSTADGADIFGQFTTAATSSGTGSQFRSVPPSLVPEPLTIVGSGMALGFGVLMKRGYSRKRKKTEQIG